MPSRPASSSLPATGSVWAMFPTYRLITGNEMGIILLVCEAAAWYAKQGMTLLDAINATLGDAAAELLKA